jgi:hypothetical protein
LKNLVSFYLVIFYSFLFFDLLSLKSQNGLQLLNYMNKLEMATFFASL